MNGSLAAGLSQILAERRALVRELLALSSRQAALVESQEFSQLNVLLANKQRLLGELDRLRQQRPRLAAEWASGRDALPPELRAECERLIADTDGLFREVWKHEQAGTAALTQHRDRIRRELESLESDAEAAKAYSALPAGRRALNLET